MEGGLQYVEVKSLLEEKLSEYSLSNDNHKPVYLLVQETKNSNSILSLQGTINLS